MNDKQYMLLLADQMEKACGVGEDFVSMTHELVDEIIAELRRRGNVKLAPLQDAEIDEDCR